MKRFKSIISIMQGHSKSSLHLLYNTLNDTEPPKIFSYNTLHFWFAGTDYRNSEKLLLYVEIPASFEKVKEISDYIPIENCFLNILAPIINDLSQEYVNEAKNTREKAQFEAQKPNELMLRRNGIHYNREKASVVLTIHFNVPLVNALSVNAKAAVRAVKDILDHIEKAANQLDPEKLNKFISCYHRQIQIRKFLKENRLSAFIANGSILPRENGTSQPMKKAVPFLSPEEHEVTVSFEDGTKLSGMGIRQGVTVITGGGYSGKSTMLDAIEAGIYNHIPGDGREYVITDDSAVKIYAEDGRPVHNLDISPFFKFLPQNTDIGEFSTLHASGSVSQAANIIEAVCAGSKLLLIDEDKSATNFMIRDLNMRKVVKNEPIIPFTDRVRALHKDKDVSTILVIGGSSEYLACADCVILMDNYVAKDITADVTSLDLPQSIPEIPETNWPESRRIVPKQTSQPFLFFRSIETENEKKIILDDYSADITLLTAVMSGDQMNTLACAMERLLTDKGSDSEELIKKSTATVSELFTEEGFRSKSLLVNTTLRWYEEIRPLDVFCCANRMRGLNFINREDRDDE